MHKYIQCMFTQIIHVGAKAIIHIKFNVVLIDACDIEPQKFTFITKYIEQNICIIPVVSWSSCCFLETGESLSALSLAIINRYQIMRVNID